MELFGMRKKRNEKDLIWRMVGELVKNQGRARLHISCNYSCTLHFIVKILLVKLKNFHTSTCLRLNYCTAKHKPKIKSCKDSGIYQNLGPIPLLILEIFQLHTPLSPPPPPPLFPQEKYVLKTLLDRNGQFLSAWEIIIKTWGTAFLGGMSKNEKVQFFNSQVHLQ